MINKLVEQEYSRRTNHTSSRSAALRSRTVALPLTLCFLLVPSAAIAFNCPVPSSNCQWSVAHLVGTARINDALAVRHDELEIVAAMGDVAVDHKPSLDRLADMLAGAIENRGMLG